MMGKMKKIQLRKMIDLKGLERRAKGSYCGG
jgi:hypothetical protein